MQLDTPKIFEKKFTVTEGDAVHFMGPGAPPVLSTPSLVNWMELTSRENAGALLRPDEDTVGMSVQIRHLAPTPVGMNVRIISRLTEVEKRVYRFEFEAFDDFEKIAEGTHERASVEVAKFSGRVSAKRNRTSSP